MAQTLKQNIQEWDTFHKNGPWPAKQWQNTPLASKQSMPDDVDRYKDAATEIQSLISEALAAGTTWRPVGSRWSLSHIAHGSDTLHGNKLLNLKFELQAPQLQADPAPNKLFLFQGGNQIKEIGIYLKKLGFSMQTMGESNGQTLAGTLGTGVHGSAWKTGSIQDGVRALHLITGPGPADSVLLQPLNSMAVIANLATQLGARLVSDDALFYSALVGLGSCGFIMGVVLEAEPLFLLRRYVGTLALNDALSFIHSLDFKTAPWKIKTLNNRIHHELNAQGEGKEPFHFKMYMNPYNSNDPLITEIMYKLPYRSNYPNPVALVRSSFPSDTINFLGNLSAKHRNSIPKLTRLFAQGVMPNPQEEPIEGTLNEIFWDSSFTGSVFAFAFGVDHRQAAPALQLFVATINDPRFGLLPGAIGIRIVKKSKATLAFTRFPVTCVIELDGLQPDTKGSQRKAALDRLDAFCAEVCRQLISAQIPFTLHWGKNARWTYPNLVQHMYGSAATEWQQSRNTLLSAPMRKVFSNPFLQDVFPI